jgi:wyosine [tRNA(Phe)-imidazoG37] synthetase (radical SAM superfamily)
LDAGDEQLFERINRPHHDISIEKLVSGLCQFRKEFSGQLWLEVFLVEGLNTAPEQITKIKDAIERIRPDKVQLNTAVRPPAETYARPVDPQTLQTIAEEFGKQCEVIADFPAEYCARSEAVRQTDVLSMLKRRPCSIDDICAGLGISRDEALAHTDHLHKEGFISIKRRGQVTFFKAAHIQK